MNIKKLLITILMVLSFASDGVCANKTYTFSSLNSGAGSIKYKDGADLANGDMAIVGGDGLGSFYELNATSAAAESSPNILAPTTNAGNKRWILKSKPYETDALMAYGGGTAYTQTTLTSACTAVGSATATILVRPGTWVQTSNADYNAICPNATFKIVPGAGISHGAFTVNIPNLDPAGLHQRFSGTGLVTLTNLQGAAYPEWWGSADFGLSLQSAINATSIVVIREGTHTFTVAHYSPGDVTAPIGVYLKDNLHIIIEKGAIVTQAADLNLRVFFAGHMWGTDQATVLTNVTIEVHGMIDGNYANQSYAADTNFQACPIALFATKSNFPIVRARNFGRYGALVLYYGPHLNVGYVYAETSYDNTYYQAKALDLETVSHANIISVMGDSLQGAMVDFPDGGSFINIDSINGKNSYSLMQMVPHAYTLGLHDIQIGQAVGEGNLDASGFYGIVIEFYEDRVEPTDISFGQVSISNAYMDGIKIATSTPATKRARRIQFGSVLLRNNGQGFGNGFTMGYCDDIKIGSLIIYDNQTPKTQDSGLAFLANATHVTISRGNITGSGAAADVYGYDPTNHHLLNVVGWITENSGTSAAIASGATIAHGLVAAPTFVSIGTMDTGITNLYWTADGTNITVTYAGGGTHTFYWYARTARNN